MAQLRGDRRVVIPEGVHYLDTDLRLRDVKDVVIEGQGATFVFTNRNAGVHIENATNLTLRDLSITYDPPPFTQGILVAMDPEGRWYDIAVDLGYPTSDDLIYDFRAYGAQMQVMDPINRSVKAGTPDFLQTNDVEKVADNVVRVRFGYATNNSKAIALGDSIVLKYRGTHGMHLRGVQDSVLENVTIYSAPHMGIVEADGGGGNIYRNVKIIPGDPPAGATRERLLSANADAFHSASMERGPILEGCFFEMMGDDGINIKGHFAYIVDVIGDEVIIAARNVSAIQQGDTLQLLDGDTINLLGTVTVERVQQVYDAQWIAKAGQMWEGKLGSTASVVLRARLVDTEVRIQAGDLVVSLDRAGRGAVIRDCTIRGNRARGMLIKAPEALIENNTFDSISLGGITIMPELQWMEGPIPYGVVIRGNRFTNMGVSDPVHLQRIPHGGSAIAVLVLDSYGSPEKSRAIQDIVIEENVFENSAVIDITVRNVSKASIRNNTGADGSPTTRIQVAASEDVILDSDSGANVVPPIPEPADSRSSVDDDDAGYQVYDDLESSNSLWTTWDNATWEIANGQLQLRTPGETVTLVATEVIDGEDYTIEARLLHLSAGQAFLGLQHTASGAYVRFCVTDTGAVYVDTTADGYFDRFFIGNNVVVPGRPVTMKLSRTGSLFRIYVDDSLVTERDIESFPLGAVRIFLQTWAPAGSTSTSTWDWVRTSTGF